MESKQRLSIGYFIAVFLMMLAYQNFFVRQQVETLAYSEFKSALKAGRVIEVTLTDAAVTGKLSPGALEQSSPPGSIAELQSSGKSPQAFATVRVDDPMLIQDLEAAKVRFSGRIESKWLATILSWIVPAVIFVALWAFLMKRMGAAGGMLEIGKSKAKVYMEKQTGVSFADVAGIDEAKGELMEVVEFLKTPERYRRRAHARPVSGRLPCARRAAAAGGHRLGNNYDDHQFCVGRLENHHQVRDNDRRRALDDSSGDLRCPIY